MVILANKIVVFGSTKELATRRLEEILNDIQYGKVKDVRKSRFDMRAELHNGDTYQISSASDSSRGMRFNIAYVDRNITLGFLNEVIRPCLRIKEDNMEDLIFY